MSRLMRGKGGADFEAAFRDILERRASARAVSLKRWKAGRETVLIVHEWLPWIFRRKSGHESAVQPATKLPSTRGPVLSREAHSFFRGSFECLGAADFAVCVGAEPALWPAARVWPAVRIAIFLRGVGGWSTKPWRIRSLLYQSQLL